MVGRDEKCSLDLLIPNFAQGFGSAGRKAISEAREFSKTHQVGFDQSCDTGVIIDTAI